MNDFLSDTLIRAIGPFYHVTSADAAERIVAEGLRPEMWDRDMYAEVQDLHGPFVCLSPSMHKYQYVHAIRWKFETSATVLLEVRTDGVAGAQVGLDLTSTELAYYRQKLGTDDPRKLIEAGAPLACYSSIAPEYITEVQRFPKVM